MVSIPCSFHLWHLGSLAGGSRRAGRGVKAAAMVGIGKRKARGGALRCRALFNLGKSAEGAGIYGSQTRDEFTHYDVEQYFDYMGMLAVEGSYDKVEALLNENIPPVDILLMLAASEGDRPKIEEVMKAGARFDVKDLDGRTALDRSDSEETRDLILELSTQKV